MTLNVKTLLIAAAVVIVVLLAVLILRPGQSAEQSQSGPAQTAAPTPTPDPAAALVRTWTNKDGVGLRFTSDGTLKLSGFGLSLGGDTFTYEVTGENTLTSLTAAVGGVLSADIVAPYAIRGNTLVIELSGVTNTPGMDKERRTRSDRNAIATTCRHFRKSELNSPPTRGGHPLKKTNMLAQPPK